MGNLMKSLIKTMLMRAGIRVTRNGHLNRFQATEDSLKSIARRGLSPTVIIDGGANIGSFARDMRVIFPDAKIHCIEPQPGCREALEKLAGEADGRVIYHPIALAAPERHGTTMAMTTDDAMQSTGAHLSPERLEGLMVPLETLDSRLVTSLLPSDRVLLKLDLQGYELEALRGSSETLSKTECIITEVSFYSQAYEPPISEIVAFLAGFGFDLYDVAAIYARPRDNRPRQGDFIFIHRDAPIARDTAWS